MWTTIVSFLATVGLAILKAVLSANAKQTEKDKLFLQHIEIYQRRRSNVGTVATDFEKKLAEALAELDKEKS